MEAACASRRLCCFGRTVAERVCSSETRSFGRSLIGKVYNSDHKRSAFLGQNVLKAGAFSHSAGGRRFSHIRNIVAQVEEPQTASEHRASVSQEQAESESFNQNESSDEEYDEDKYVEIGVVVGTHGVKGELVVRSLTDFPKQRFGTPGTRWLRRPGRRQQALVQVELLKGRKGPSRKGKGEAILLKFKGIDTPEDAATYQGCYVLALADDRPELREGEFFTRDLVGLQVALKETGEVIGTVEEVVSIGPQDSLKVKRTDLKARDGSDKEFFTWVPFVEQICPVVNMKAQRIEITPPEGLLEMGIRLGPSPAQERRQRVLATVRRKREISKLKKEFTKAGQAHLFAGLYDGFEKQQEELLEDLKSLDLKALKSALSSAQALSTSAPVKPYPPPPFPKAHWGDRGLETPPEDGASASDTQEWYLEGLRMVARREAAAMVLAGGQGTRLGPQAPPAKGMLDIGLPSGKSLFQLQAERLQRVQALAQQMNGPDAVPPIPWLVMTSDATDAPTRTFFSDHSYFGLEESQILFVKQGTMPCVSVKGANPILLETPWKVARAPDGNGGVFQALHVSGGIEWLQERGVKFVQAYAVDNALVRVADPVFYGYCKERDVDVGIKVVAKTSPEESVGVVCLKEEGGETAKELEPKVEKESEPLSEEMQKELVSRIMETTEWSEKKAREEMLRIEGGLLSRDEQGFEDEDEYGEYYEDEYGEDEYYEDDTEFYLGESELDEVESSGQRASSTASTSGSRYYSVLEYSELPKELIHARDPPSSSGSENALGELQFRAAHICVNMFSVDFLARLGSSDEASLPFHSAKKKIKHVVKESTWREVSPEVPNGIKLERFIFDAFRFCPEERVAILEVERAEEFAPIKNAAGPSVPDSPETARDMVLAYHKRLLSAAGIELNLDKKGLKSKKENGEKGNDRKKKDGEEKGKDKKSKGKKKDKRKGSKEAPDQREEEPIVLALGEIPPLTSYAGEGLHKQTPVMS